MKKILAIVAAVALSVSLAMPSFAAGPDGFGVVAGLTSASTKIRDFETKNVTGYQIGVAYKIPLVLGFAIQPGVVYSTKGTGFEQSMAGIKAIKFDTSAGYLEIPVQVQWGPDLLAFRPYVLAEPFLGCKLNSKQKLSIGDHVLDLTSRENKMNVFEYGLGLGAGIELGPAQLSFKYFWNFGELMDDMDLGDAWDSVEDALEDQRSFNGFTINLGIFF